MNLFWGLTYHSSPFPICLLPSDPERLEEALSEGSMEPLALRGSSHWIRGAVTITVISVLVIALLL